MNITLHIDRLVLDGIDVSAADRPRLAAAVEQELGRLFAAGGGVHPALAGGTSVPSVQAPPMPAAPPGNAAALGTNIARAVHGGIGNGGR
jgi:hypothetical protein